MVASPKKAKASDTAISFAGIFASNFANVNEHLDRMRVKYFNGIFLI